VAHLLVDLAAEGTPSSTGVLLRNGLTQDDLAGMVGASRESVARALATLRELGLVSTGRRRWPCSTSRACGSSPAEPCVTGVADRCHDRTASFATVAGGSALHRLPHRMTAIRH
jgi:Crp-like helix-turn-helix domain